MPGVAALAAGCGSFHRILRALCASGGPAAVANPLCRDGTTPKCAIFAEAKVRQLAASRPGLSGGTADDES